MRYLLPHRLLILLGITMTALSCCVPAEKASRQQQTETFPARMTESDSNWYERIEARRATAPLGSIDPVSGERIRDFAEQEFSRPMSREVAFKILLNTDTFSEGPVGQGSRGKSVQVEAFQVLLAQPDAVAAFTNLLKRARAAGQLYALCGLRLWDPARYAAVEPAFAGSKVSVQVESGDIGSTRTVGELVKSSEPKTVRLLPGETIEKWELRANSFDGEAYDISGGGYPEEFREE
jgi:hypothetical protein